MIDLNEAGIRENYLRVVERISNAACSAGRNPGEIKLVVVSKGHPIEVVQEAVKAGVRVLGENYVQEGIEKIEACSFQPDIEWHMIGHIQSRKARMVSEKFSWIESVDSLKIANRLNNFAHLTDRILPVLLECNVSGETSKYGFPCWNQEQRQEVSDVAGQIIQFKHLKVNGLMTMPPLTINPEQARPFFRRLVELRDYFRARFPATNWTELSMGMSADFEIAIQEGATIIRVGTAILGPRSCTVDLIQEEGQ